MERMKHGIDGIKWHYKGLWGLKLEHQLAVTAFVMMERRTKNPAQHELSLHGYR
jgi:hypothetical protein